MDLATNYYFQFIFSSSNMMLKNSTVCMYNIYSMFSNYGLFRECQFSKSDTTTGCKHEWGYATFMFYLLKRSSHLRDSTSWYSDFSSKQSHRVGFMVTKLLRGKKSTGNILDNYNNITWHEVSSIFVQWSLRLPISQMHVETSCYIQTELCAVSVVPLQRLFLLIHRMKWNILWWR